MTTDGFRSRSIAHGVPWLVALAVVLAACGRDAIDPDALRDPASCMGCHPDHTTEWAGSMHAQASDDPVFLAMNRLALRETDGLLGDFCLRCHAPTAVALGATVGDLQLDDLPRELRGVTCVACHQIEAVDQLHNGGLRWTHDDVMRGALPSPRTTPAHASASSELVDTSRLESSAACGACHDVVLPGGVVAIERTYAEWSESLFAQPGVGLSCGACHMIGRDGPAVVDGPVRRVHEHSMAAVDVALVPWPGVEDQRVAIDRDLKGSVATKLCVTPGAGGLQVEVVLDNTQVGHAFPSGTTHARRLWVELVADTDGVESWVAGRHAPGEIVHAGNDPDTWVLGSQFHDANGAEVQMAWQAASITSELLLPSVTNDPTDPRFFHGRARTYQVPGSPARIRLALRLQPIGLDVLDVLISSGDLDPAVRAAMPVLELTGARLEWLAARDGFGCVP